MKNALLVLFTVGIFLISFASSADVAYLYNKPLAIDDNVVDVFEELGLTVDFIQDKNIRTTNFNNYKFIFVNDERFREGLNYIPIATKPGIISNYYYGEEFGLTDYDGVSQLAGTSPLSVNVNNQIIQVYTQALFNTNRVAIPYYFLDDENKVPQFMTAARTYTGNNNGQYNFGDVVSYANAGVRLINGQTTQGRLCFFGIIESDYWTPAAKQMFIDCVGFVSIECYSNNDCAGNSQSNSFCSQGDSFQNLTSFTCQNPGTVQAQCVQTTQTNLLQDCGENSVFNSSNYCFGNDVVKNVTSFNKGCLSGNCFSNNNTQQILVENCTDDQVCSNGACIDRPITCSTNSQCGTNGWLGNEVCQLGSVYDDYINFTCNLAGTPDSYCTNATALLPKQTCSVGCVDGSCVDCLQDSDCSNDTFGDPFCKQNNVFNQFTDFSCVNNQCVSDTSDQLNETCADDEVCSNGECLQITCSKHTDCGINGFTGLNYCSFGNSQQDFVSYTCHNAGTVQSYCSNFSLPILQNYCEGDCVSGECVTCFNDLSCGEDTFVGDKYCVGSVAGDVYQDYKEYSCINPTTNESDCLSSVAPRLIESCSEDEVCVSGECLQITCTQNSDCNDANSTTFDECISPGQANSYCRNTPINCASNSDCGFTGYFGNEFCSSNDVFKNYQSAVCNNPGQLNSYCTVNITPNFLQDCGEDSCGEYGQNYCSGSNVYKNRTCNDAGCNLGACVSSQSVESTFVETCEFGCSNGACLNDTRVHDVGFIDMFNAVNKIKITYPNGTAILSNQLVENQAYQIIIDVKNKGNFTENISYVGQVGNISFNHSKTVALLSGLTTGDQIKLVNFSLTPGVYNLTINSLIEGFVDVNTSDNVVIRQIEVVSGAQCVLNSDCGTNVYGNWSENYCYFNDVARDRDVLLFSCNSGMCENNSVFERQIVEDCSYGCSDGRCLPAPTLCGNFSLTVTNLRNGTGIKPACPETYWYYYDLVASETTGNASINLTSRQRTWLNNDTEPIVFDLASKFGTTIIQAGANITAYDRWFCTDFSPDQITETIVGASLNCSSITKQYSIYVTP